MNKLKFAAIELKDLHLTTQIGTYDADDSIPEFHTLDLTLEVLFNQVLIKHDGMDQVFDYDPLIAEIDRLADDGDYKTQERLITRIACACAAYPSIKKIEICLKKFPVRSGNGSIGIRMMFDETAIDELRSDGALND